MTEKYPHLSMAGLCAYVAFISGVGVQVSLTDKHGSAVLVVGCAVSGLVNLYCAIGYIRQDRRALAAATSVECVDQS